MLIWGAFAFLHCIAQAKPGLYRAEAYSTAADNCVSSVIESDGSIHHFWWL